MLTDITNTNKKLTLLIGCQSLLPRRSSTDNVLWSNGSKDEIHRVDSVIYQLVNKTPFNLPFTANFFLNIYR